VDQESFPELTFKMQNHITEITTKEKKLKQVSKIFWKKWNSVQCMTMILD